MSPHHVRISKRLSLVLRHRPESVGIVLDAGGWAHIDALLAGLARRGTAVDRATLDAVVAGNDKQRFAISADGRRIRAVQGHSRPVDLGLAAVAPPPTLYHGTVARFLDAIRREGLKPRGRQYVHLSRDTTTATVVGARRGSAVVLTIRAGTMVGDGHAFFRAENGVWLCRAVPARYIEFP
jgi:putative RNA 2'-phosphotransferase